MRPPALLVLAVAVLVAGCAAPTEYNIHVENAAPEQTVVTVHWDGQELCKDWLSSGDVMTCTAPGPVNGTHELMVYYDGPPDTFTVRDATTYIQLRYDPAGGR